MAAEAKRFTITGATVGISYVPTNYTPTSANLDGHLEGIDTAIGRVELWLRPVAGTTYLKNLADQVIIGATSTTLSPQLIVTDNAQFGSNDAVYSQSVTVAITSEGIGNQPLLIERMSSSFPFAQGPNLLQIGGAGTSKTPTQTQAGSIIGGFSGSGVDDLGARTNNFTTGVLAYTSENHTTIAQGTYLGFGTVLTGTTTGVDKMWLTTQGYLGVNEQDAITYVHAKVGSSGLASVTTAGMLIEGEGFAALTINTGASGVAYINLGDAAADDEGQILYDNSTKAMILSANALEGIRINSSQNVGIGGIEPVVELHIFGNNTSVTPISGTRLFIEHATSCGITIANQGTGTGFIAFGDNSDNNVGMIEYFHNGNRMEFTVAGNEWLRATASEVTVNEGSSGRNFRIETNGDANAFVASGTADNIGMGILTPDASAKLDISSTTQGFLMPRMTTTERDAITLPAKGLAVYNTTTDQWEGNSGTSGTPVWVILG